MSKLLADWQGKRVFVTLRNPTSALWKGTLVAVDATGVLVQMANGVMYLPFTSLLHVSLAPEEPPPEEEPPASAP